MKINFDQNTSYRLKVKSCLIIPNSPIVILKTFPVSKFSLTTTVKRFLSTSIIWAELKNIARELNFNKAKFKNYILITEMYLVNIFGSFKFKTFFIH